VTSGDITSHIPEPLGVSGIILVNQGIPGVTAWRVVTTAGPSASGTIGGSGDFVVVSTGGMGSAGFVTAISSGWNGTVIFEVSVDGSRWDAVTARRLDSLGIISAITTENSGSVLQLVSSLAGTDLFRLLCTSYASGSIFASLVTSAVEPAPFPNLPP